jgi:lipopolysaccharide transport system ATP-binding protein
MSSSDLAIRVSGLSKAYTIRHQAEQHITLAEQVLSRVRHPFQKADRETFWALRDVDLEVKRGEVLGIIGRNGAGKSTLLKVLSRITAPTAGRVELYGRLGSLLEVGTGFHAELTGRENIYLNGTILGMKRAEIDRRFDEIVEFAGVSQFLDTPVKRYSSGMYVRLAFAVAAHLDTEILVLDEVLAVGDQDFQRRSLERIGTAMNQGRAVLLVSHNLSLIQEVCQRSVLLRSGRIVGLGPSGDVVSDYRASQRPEDNELPENRIFSSCRIIGEPRPGEPVRLGIGIKPGEPAAPFFVRLHLNDHTGKLVAQCDSRLSEAWFKISAQSQSVVCEIRSPWLKAGVHTVDLYAFRVSEAIEHVPLAASFLVSDHSPYGAPIPEESVALTPYLPDFTYEVAQ